MTRVIFLSIIALTFAINATSQTWKVVKTDSTVYQFPASEIDYITVSEEAPDSTFLFENCIEREMEALHNSMMYCRVSNQSLTWSYHSGSKDILIEMRPHGGNMLFDFSRFSYREGSSSPLSELASNWTKDDGLSTGTDWHAPFQAGAVNNIDGDNFSGEDEYNINFTGGNHQYNNKGSGSTPTASLKFLSIKVDGRTVSSYAGYCSEIDVEWINQVQGYNTTVALGGGREILKETHNMHINNGNITERIMLTPLEDIKFINWYGIQASARNLSGIQFVGSTNRSSLLSTNVNSISKECEEMVLFRETISLALIVNQQLDLGMRKYVVDNYPGAFRATGTDKYYFRIIKLDKANAPIFNEGNRYYLDCGYRFY